MEILIPNTFDNFKQRLLQRGMETCSTTEYKGFQIFLRAYAFSGIRYKIFKIEGDKKVKYRERGYNFKLPILMLEEAKNWIDFHLQSKNKQTNAGF